MRSLDKHRFLQMHFLVKIDLFLNFFMGMIRFYDIYQLRKRKFIKYLNIKLDITNLLSFIHVLLLIIKNN
jgi:hypothetical protein